MRRVALLSVGLAAGAALSVAAQDKKDAATQPANKAAVVEKRTVDGFVKKAGNWGDSFGNAFTLAPTIGLNIRTTFKNIGGFTAQTATSPAGGGLPHEYDDGYVRADGRGIADGKTWNWGYFNASQVPGNNTVLMSSSSSPADASARAGGGDYKSGFELRFLHRLGAKENLRWGIEGAFGWNDLSAKDNRALAGTLVLVTDTYSLNGNIPPAAPATYLGNAAGPGPLIDDTAVPPRTTTTTPGGATVTGERKLEASLLALKLGPHVEWRPSPESRWGLGLNAGFAMAMVDSTFSFSESVNIPTMGAVLQPGLSATQARSASGHTTDILFGGYVGLSASYRMTDRLSLTGGGQYQNVGTFSQTVAGKQAEIGLGNAILVTLGLRYSF